jgi:hypothetical protein
MIAAAGTNVIRLSPWKANVSLRLTEKGTPGICSPPGSTQSRRPRACDVPFLARAMVTRSRACKRSDLFWNIAGRLGL